MKTAYLADQRRCGDANDPFLEADRRETAKQEAAARRVHPTLHLPASSQPLTQVAGLIASSASSAPHTSAAVLTASSGSGSSLFSTPSAATSSSSLFSTPTPTASAPTASLFGVPGASPQSSLFGPSMPSLGNTPSLLGVPSAGVSSFSTPFASGTFYNMVVYELGMPLMSLEKLFASDT